MEHNDVLTVFYNVRYVFFSRAHLPPGKLGSVYRNTPERVERLQYTLGPPSFQGDDIWYWSALERRNARPNHTMEVDDVSGRR